MLQWMKRYALPLVLLPLVAAACGDSTTPQQTAVTLELTDDAGDLVDNVWIEVGQIYLQGAGGRQDLLTSAEAEGLQLMELTELDDETVTLVDGKVIPSGSYGQLRFVVESAVLEADGKFYSYNGAVPPGEDPSSFEADGDLVCPSCNQTGIKALLPQEDLPVEGDQQIYALDFDVGRSFGREAGASGQWVMSPIIVTTNLELTGTITGTVSLAEGVTIPDCPADPATPRDLTVFEATATAQNLVDENSDPVVYTDHPDTEGNLAIQFLDPDTYDMGFSTPVAVTDNYQIAFTGTVSPETVDVTSNDETSVAYTIESATCQSSS